jgi:adenylate cyclase
VVAAARKVVEIAEQEMSRHPENARPAYLGAGSLIELGEHDRAREWIARAMATDPDDLLTQYNVACVYSKLGELDAAFDLLERLLPHANHETKAWVRHDPDFEALREQPRYQRLLALLS